MDGALSHEQEAMRSAMRRFLAEHCGPAEVRRAVASPAGHDEAVWRRLAAEFGLPGLAIAPQYGGVGCGSVELALVCEEAGRALLPSPLTATVAIAAPVVASLGTPEQRARLLPLLAAGELTGAFVLPNGSLPEALALTGPNDGDWAGGGRAGGIQARRHDGGWRLYGEAAQVLDGHCAGLLLVAARHGGYTKGRTLLFLVRPEHPGRVRRTRATSLDETRPQSRVELRDADAELLGPEGADVPRVLAGLAGPIASVVAAEAVGTADGALQRTVEYVRVREQFGRPVGSFQAVRHRLAELHVAVREARSAAYYAAWSGRPDVAGLALAAALETASRVTGEAIQLHGGIGVTWEHPVQLYFKRAASDELLFGPVNRLRARAAETAGVFAAGAGGEAVVL
ncbi:acyl-CoA dehydrogenase [Streptomyces mashuensis]|uniref:Acyl-CoA dehydrogenase n=1 Tax=Streptomyces mashuensis TaxID=33904 RepID=A0A919B5I9_9ACTN|nr:acyl-CoA dehydrogenase family protein [Streptomyces mashuensis]GHF57981.1 acyl-CoA dehydrogenase [Streptomyces mashuensis]